MMQISELHNTVASKDAIIDSLNKKISEIEVRFATIKRDVADKSKAAQAEIESLQKQLADKDAKLEALGKKVKRETQKVTQTKRRKERLEDEVATHDLALDETHKQVEDLVSDNLDLSIRLKEAEKSINKAAKHAYQTQKWNDHLMRSNLHLAALIEDRISMSEIPEEEVSIPVKVHGSTPADKDCDEERFSVVWEDSKTKVALVRRSILEVHYTHLIENFEKAQRRGSRASKSGAVSKENEPAQAQDTPTKSSKSKKPLRNITPLSPASAELLATNSLPSAPNVSVHGAIEATTTI
jgi:chromosome segregation ATPase